MGGPFASLLARKLAALAATIVIAPTVAWRVFAGLSGQSPGQSLPSIAADYVVKTFWHFDLGISDSYYGTPVAEVVSFTLPADLAMVFGAVASGVLLGLAGGLACAIGPDRGSRARGAVRLRTDGTDG